MWAGGTLNAIEIIGVLPAGVGRRAPGSARGRFLRLNLLAAFRLVGQPVEVCRKRQQGIAVVQRARRTGSQAQLIGASVIILGASWRRHNNSFSRNAVFKKFFYRALARS